MIVACLIAIFQYFAPGVIVLAFTGLSFNVVKKTVLSFTISQIINFILIFTLTYFKCYNRQSVYILLVLELLILLYIYFKGSKKPYTASVADKYAEFVEVAQKPLGKLATAAALLSVIIVILLMASNVGEIFGGWDPVFSWNKWAVSFFNNSLPTGIRHYPQLIPANWSVTYVLIGEPLQFLPKAMMPLYLLFILLSIIDIALIEKSIGVMLGVVITLIIFVSARVSFEGYVDTPVAFFVFQSFYLLYIANTGGDKKNKITYLILAGLVAAGAGVTKQAGLYLIILYPFFCYSILSKNKEPLSVKIKVLGIFLTFVIIIVLPFYLYANQQIATGKSVSEIAWVTNGIYGNKSMAERFFDALGLLNKLIRVPYLIYPLIVLFFYSLKEKKLRPISVLFTLPYFFIWAFYFSYDLRNLSITYPLIGISLGIGLYQFLLLILTKVPEKQVRISIVVSVVLMATFFVLQGDKKYTIKYYKDVHTKLEKKICLPALNELIYKYAEQHGITGKIATDYPILDFLPDFKKYAVTYTPALLVSDSIGYVLIRENDYNKSMISKLLMQAKAKKATLIFYYSDINDYKYYNYYRYYFFKIK